MTWARLGSPDALRGALDPLLEFDRCESAAFVRSAISHAARKDLAPLSPYVDLLPSPIRLSLGAGLGRTAEALDALQTEEDYNRAAANASAHLRGARIWFREAGTVPDTVRSTMYYYGALSFFKFVTSCLVKTRSSKGAHGLSVSCTSEGWDFDRDWPRKSCLVSVDDSGDFPFLVDVLTAAGWPSLFSTFRLHQDSKVSPASAKSNPAPLATRKVSLDFLCNFDYDRHLANNPEIARWLEGENVDRVGRITSLLLDFIIVYISSSLERYYVPAWTGVLAATKSAVYNDIRAAYRSLSTDAPFFFAEEHPFKYSFSVGTPQ